MFLGLLLSIYIVTVCSVCMEKSQNLNLSIQVQCGNLNLHVCIFTKYCCGMYHVLKIVSVFVSSHVAFYIRFCISICICLDTGQGFVSSHVAFGSKLVIRSGLQEAYFPSHDGDDDDDHEVDHDHDDNDDDYYDDGLGLNYKVIDMSTKIVSEINI